MHTPTLDTFQQAVSLTRMGEPERARTMFLRTVQENPDCFEAWLWLSELTSNLEEQTAMLEQAVRRMPAGDGKCLQDHLSALRGSAALPAPAPEAPDEDEQLNLEHIEAGYQRAARLAAAGQRAEARKALYMLFPGGARDARVWWLISTLEADAELAIFALEQLLEINPQHDLAQQRLKALIPQRDNPLRAARMLEALGETAQAADMYRLLADQASSPAMKAEMLQQVAFLQARSGAHARAGAPSSSAGQKFMQFTRALFARAG